MDRGRRHPWANRWLRTWLVPSTDEVAQRTRKGRLAGGLYLIADVYAAIVTGYYPQARPSQTIIVGFVAVLAVTLIALPWHRFSDSVLIWPVVPSAFLTTLGEGWFGVLHHYQPIYVLALGYAGLVLRPGRTTLIARLNLVLLVVVAGTGRQAGPVSEIIGTIVGSALIGELIATANAAQRRQRADLERLHDGLRPLLGAQTEHDVAQLVSETAAHLLHADGAATLVPGHGDRDGGTLVALGRCGDEDGPPGAPGDIDTAARTRQHLFRPRAPGPEPVSGSVLYVPIVPDARLAGVMVI